VAFYFRDLINARPFRLSKSGLVSSVGALGLRFGTGRRDRYFRAGGGGLWHGAPLEQLLPDDEDGPLPRIGEVIASTEHAAPGRFGAIVMAGLGCVAAIALIFWSTGPSKKPAPALLATPATPPAQRPIAASPRPPGISPKQEAAAPQPAPNGSVNTKWFAKGNVNVRAKPSTSSPAVRRLPAGTAVTSLRVENGWRRISADGTEGWVRADLLAERTTRPDPGIVSSIAVSPGTATSPAPVPSPRPAAEPRNVPTTPPGGPARQ
jgi:uncharacterized protein YraI